MIPTDQDHREAESERVIAKATASLTRAQRATEQARKAIALALKAGNAAQEQLARRRKR